MAHHTVLVDDINGEKADETVSFGLDGVSYEIDLTANNASQLRTALTAYIAAARQHGVMVSRPGRGTVVMTTQRLAPSNRTLREWAKANGFTVSEKGRVPAHVVDAFQTANA